MSQHTLLELATRRPYIEIPDMPEGAFYEKELGYWVLNGEPLVQSENYKNEHVTKKCDQETGEDQKGE